MPGGRGKAGREGEEGEEGGGCKLEPRTKRAIVVPLLSSQSSSYASKTQDVSGACIRDAHLQYSHRSSSRREQLPPSSQGEEFECKGREEP